MDINKKMRRLHLSLRYVRSVEVVCRQQVVLYDVSASEVPHVDIIYRLLNQLTEWPYAVS
jgi:hypothetical protein